VPAAQDALEGRDAVKAAFKPLLSPTVALLQPLVDTRPRLLVDDRLVRPLVDFALVVQGFAIEPFGKGLSLGCQSRNGKFLLKTYSFGRLLTIIPYST